MRTRVATLMICLSLLSAAPALAQYGARFSSRATGETYNVEIGGFLWNPTPDVIISSEGFGLLGSQISLVDDLQMEKHWVRQLRVAVRPGEKHKFRFEYTPIKYENEEAVLRRELVFNGISFPVALPVDAEVIWRAFRFGYEWDFVYRDRGFVGLLLDVKYTHVEATLANALDTEFVRARAPIPAIGFIGRGYVMPNVSITGEFSFFKLPEDIDEDYGGKYFDLDIYGTVNFNDHVGVQGGYRSFDVFYKIEDDEGDLQLKGIYLGAVVRF